jgi:hypothetical protein
MAAERMRAARTAVDGFSREGYKCRCWAHEMDCARMGGCDPVRGPGEGHIVQWGAPSNSQPKPIAGQLLAYDKTWCRRSRNPQHAAAARQPAEGPKPAAGRRPAECRRCCRRILRVLTRRSPATGRSRLPDGGPQSAADGVVGAGELPTRSSPATGRSRLPNSSP